MRLLVASCLVLTAAASTPTCDAFPGSLTVATNFTVACIRSSDGSLAAYVDVHSGRTYASYTSIFNIIFSRDFEALPVLTSDSFGSIDVASTPEGCVRAVFSNATTYPALVVQTLVCAAPAGGIELLEWSANITGVAAGVAVQLFTFPVAAQPLRFSNGSPSADFFLMGQSDSVLLAVSNSTAYSLTSTYPGDASVQLLARYDDVAGLALYTADSGAHVKRFSTTSVPSAGYCVQSVSHVPPEVAGVDLVLPYPIAMTTFTGDWRDAADIYKAWAVRQWWAKTPLTERADIPRVLLSGGAGWTPGLQTSEGFNPAAFGPHLEALPNASAATRALLGVPSLVTFPYGWEFDGTWAGVFYDPMQPSTADWAAAAGALAAQGDAAGFLVSGYWWVEKRNTSQNGPAFDNSGRLPELASSLIVNATGGYYTVDAYADPTGPENWRGLSHKLCHGANGSAAVLLPVFTSLVDTGGAVLSFDQEIGGGQDESGCYEAAHGHSPGWGPWMFTDFNATLGSIAAYARAAGKRVGLSTEQVCCHGCPVPARLLQVRCFIRAPVAPLHRHVS